MLLEYGLNVFEAGDIHISLCLSHSLSKMDIDKHIRHLLYLADGTKQLL